MTRWRRSRAERHPRRAQTDEQGAAVVDFVLVSMLLVPLVLGLLQVALVLHVRNTLASSAAEGARYAAALERTPADGVARTRSQIEQALADRYADDVTARAEVVDGVPTVVVEVRASVPPLGLWGPGVEVSVQGHAVAESLP